MSEYQYDDFLAVDRPLTAAGRAEVRQLADLRELARRAGQAGEFVKRLASLREQHLREQHLREPSLIARLDRAGLTA